jgi:membrane fusion protein (multidrug efflux system)
MREIESGTGIGGAGRTVVMEIDPALLEAHREVPAIRQPIAGPVVEHEAEPAGGEPKARKSGRRRWLFLLAGLAVLGGASWYGYDWWTNGRFIVSTDDAYVSADAATIAPKVAGYIESIAAGDNARV